MDHPVINLLNPGAVEVVPELKSLIAEASVSLKVAPEVLTDELRRMAVDDKVAILVKPFTTLAILTLPRGTFIDDPQMVHFYNRGKHSDTEDVLKAAVDFLKGNGYNRALALNLSGKPDAAWAKTLTPVGWTAKHKASLYEFEGPKG